MRAIFDNRTDFKEKALISVTDDRAHHLIKVIRVRIKDQVLLLNGQGERAHCVVTTVNRQEVQLKVVSVTISPRRDVTDVAMGLLKRDAMADNLRASVELGIGTIYPLLTEFSQRDFLKEERVAKIFESACIQSNAPYLPIVKEVQELNDSLIQKYDQVIVFSTNQTQHNPPAEIVPDSKKLLVIGPEGGFSDQELEAWKDKCSIVCLPTNILRASTALPVVAGWLLGKIYRE